MQPNSNLLTRQRRRLSESQSQKSASRLSLALIGIFAVYAFGRHVYMGSGTPDTVVIVPPAKLSSSSSNATSSVDSTVVQVISSAPNMAQASSSLALYVPPASSSAPTGKYKDGQYTGPSTDAYYGNVQVKVTVSGGQVADVQFLDYPQDRGTSVYINSQAMPILKSEAIQMQTAPVDAVSGATYTSQAFNQSLASALSQARI